mmetsp:Transcript_8943/g.20149  ORF Transcript_8943/g.20149 Transcript_8943/m.20149 type:complete len:451 (+) Transcript_8943:96-1448(+)|eukprot:CAMPEP_0172616016 /NCGR_PEP_ID=MMETSP1068-20121228/62657_1 /TAXON_ID=35684 /ORGANISM="Pseudopedinella elastica, Strain CCMP716" /LENGTH=450 /DNA_ID=CAMNT_0013421331 /DNA_START=96 /DNA_END=1448 /DNA_ORIENTATION=-
MYRRISLALGLVSATAAWDLRGLPRAHEGAKPRRGSFTACTAKKKANAQVRKPGRVTGTKGFGKPAGKTGPSQKEHGPGDDSPSSSSSSTSETAVEYDADEEHARYRKAMDWGGCGPLRMVSREPLVFDMESFLSPEACALAPSSPGVQLAFRERVAVRLFDGQSSPRDGLRFNSASSGDAWHDAYSMGPADAAAAGSSSSSSSVFPDGVHVDTNNGCLFRHCTCILYLNDVPDALGGATLFPLAADRQFGAPPAGGASPGQLLKHEGRAGQGESLLAASRQLLEADIMHTRSCGTERQSGATLQPYADALELSVQDQTSGFGSWGAAGENGADEGHEGHEASRGCLRVQPKVGRLCIFFTRLQDGSVDPLSWHGGERIRDPPPPPAVLLERPTGRSVTEKHILTLFKEVDYAGRAAGVSPPETEETLESYFAPFVKIQRLALQAQAEGG